MGFITGLIHFLTLLYWLVPVMRTYGYLPAYLSISILFLFAALLALFVASFAVSLGPVMWVMLPEIFPNKVRGVGMAMTGVVNSAVSFGVQFAFPWQLTNLGVSNTFGGYALFAIIGLALVLWLVPETRGRTLEELESDFRRRSLA